MSMYQNPAVLATVSVKAYFHGTIFAYDHLIACDFCRHGKIVYNFRVATTCSRVFYPGGLPYKNDGGARRNF